jgi:phosphatidylglycerol---prolipoprotein diacylglyceryl transferase
VHQVLLRIPVPFTESAITLHGYGAMLCVGFLLAILVAAWRAKRLNQSPDIIYNLALASFLGGLVGSRAFYVIQYGDTYNSVWDYVKIWEGGLTFYGGLLLGVACVVGYLKLARLPMLYWLDIAVPSVALGEGFGRLGCFLNGCCYGATCPPGWGFSWPAGTIPWQHYADQAAGAAGLSAAGGGGAGAAVTGALAASWQAPAIYPTQLLSFVNAVLLFLALHLMFRSKRRHGQILLMFILLYGVSRFMLECLRADEAREYLLGLPTLLTWLGQVSAVDKLPLLTISQNLAVVMVAASAVGLIVLMRSRRPELQAAYAPPATLMVRTGANVPRPRCDETGGSKPKTPPASGGKRRKDAGP